MNLIPDDQAHRKGGLQWFSENSARSGGVTRPVILFVLASILHAA